MYIICIYVICNFIKFDNHYGGSDLIQGAYNLIGFDPKFGPLKFNQIIYSFVRFYTIICEKNRAK